MVRNQERMPKLLPLYPVPTEPCDMRGFQSALGVQEPQPRDPNCTDCTLNDGRVRTICMPADGSPGGVFFVGEKPGRVEDDVGRPNWGESGSYLRKLVKKHYSGPVAYDNAVRCAPGRREVTPDHVDACRPYVAGALRACKPKRIVALGAWAFYSV